MPNSYRSILFFLFIIWQIPGVWAQQETQKLQHLVQDLYANDAFAKLSARLELRKFLESSDEQDRPLLIQELITALPSYPAHVKNSICNVIDSLNFFWTTPHQEEMEKKLYKLYQKENEPGLKMIIDRALMKAKGLYRDAMNDFNNDKIDPSVEKKFQRIYQNYPDSAYAAKAHFYFGLYPLRACAVAKKQNHRSVNSKEFIIRSNQNLQDFLNEATSGTYRGNVQHIMDAHYFRALNFVLLNQVSEAIKELKSIEENDTQEKIYIFQFFYSNMIGENEQTALVSDNEVIDDFFDAQSLAKYTRQYLEKQRDFSKSENLRKLLDYLMKFKTQQPDY